VRDIGAIADREVPAAFVDADLSATTAPVWMPMRKPIERSAVFLRAGLRPLQGSQDVVASSNGALGVVVMRHGLWPK